MKTFTLFFFGLLLSSLSYAQVPTSGLTGEYKFAGGALTGLTQTGAALTTETDRLGVATDAVSLNGDHLSRATINSPYISASFWIKTTTNDATQRTIIDQTERASAANGASERGWYTYLQNGNISMGGNFYYAYYYGVSPTGEYRTFHSGYYFATSTTAIADGEWHHVLGTAEPVYPGGTSLKYVYKIYIDGVLEDSETVEVLVSPNTLSYSLLPTNPVVIGNNSNATLVDTYEDGIDDIRFYGSSLTAFDIEELAKEDICSFPRVIEVDAVTESSAAVSWTSNDLPDYWELSYAESGGVPDEGTIISNLTNKEYNLTALNPTTDYEVYLRSYCNGSLTDWSESASFSTGSVVYVNATATGNSDGTSWTDAYTNLNTAISASSSTDFIWVAAGTYTPGSSRTSAFTLGSAKLYGGFNGTETSRSERDPLSNPTILSGDLNGDDNANIVDTETTRQDNSYHVMTIYGNVQEVVVDGFTISGGNANGGTSTNCGTPASQQYYHPRGGAIYIQPTAIGHAPSAQFVNCIIEKNSGINVGVLATYTPCGLTGTSSDVDFESCIIRNNYSGTLPALLYAGSSGYGHYSRGSLVNCLFYDNTSNTSASCLYLGISTANGGTAAGLDVEVINSTFSNNIATNGNVVSFISASNSNIYNSIFYGNGSATPFAISGSASAISNTIVEGGQEGGIDSDPLFEDAANDDYGLSCSSPAIDAGDATGLTLPESDLLGETRINGTLDMGAIEFNTPIFGSITAVAQDITAQLDETGNVTISPEAVDGGSGAACGTEFSLSLDVASFDCTDLGANAVILTATETGGATSTSSATVTIVDQTGPTVVTQNITVALDATGNATIATEDIDNGSSDNCTSVANLGFSLDKTAFTCADLGEQTVTLTVTDEAGNESTDTARVTVQDVTAPTVVAQDITSSMGSDGTLTVAASDFDNGSSDNCTDASNLTFSLDKTSFTCEDLGTNAVMLTVTDESGNESSIAATLTITSSIADEMVTIDQTSLCPGTDEGATVSTLGSATGVNYYLRDSEDNTVISGPIEGTGSAIDFETGAITASRTFHVFAEPVAQDSRALDFDGADDRVSADIEPSFDYENGYTLQAWVNGPLTSSTKHYPIFHIGTATTSDVEVYLQNASNRMIVVHNRRASGGATAKEFPTPPANTWYQLSITYDGADIKTYYDGVEQTALAQTTAGGLLTRTTGATLSMGYVLNASGWGSALRNFAGKMDEVRIWNAAKSATDILETKDGCLAGTESGLVGYYNFDEGSGTTVTDLVGGFDGTLVNMDANTDWIDGATITCSAGCGVQMATEVTITVEDTTPPVAIAQDLTIQLDAQGNADVAAADVNNGSTDNCTAEGALNMSLDISSFTCAEVGANTVTMTVTDASGNSATATATVIVEDNTNPVAITQDVTVQLDADGNASTTAGAIDDGSSAVCGGALILSLDQSAFTCSDLGENTVTLTVTDGNGNSTTGAATVTVTDDTPPTAVAQDMTVILDATGNVSITADEVNNGSSDNCTAAGDLVFSLDVTDFSCADLGTNTVTLTVSDGSSNSSATTAVVTVVDNLAPLVIARNISVNLDANGQAVISASDIDDGSSDNCEVSLSLDITSFTLADLGANVVTLTGTDASGNSSSATATVTVEDKQSQTITITTLNNKVYGDADFTLEATASSGLSVSFAVVSGPALVSGNTVSITGIGDVTIEASQAGDADFLSASEEATFSVSPAALTATADNQSIIYGAAIPQLTVSYSGFVNGEDASVLTTAPVASTVAEGDSDAGTYSIELSAGAAENYTITTVPGTLTINPATATITIADLEHIVDGTSKVPVVTTDPAGLSFTMTYDDAPDAPSAIGNYLVEVTIDEINYAGSATATLVISNILGLESSAIRIYPNPVTSTFEAVTDEPLDIEVFDLSGHLLLRTLSNQVTDVSHLSNGTYLVKILSLKKQEAGVYRLIKK